MQVFAVLGSDNKPIQQFWSCRDFREDQVQRRMLAIFNTDRESRKEPHYTWEVFCEVFEDAPWGPWKIGPIEVEALHYAGGKKCHAQPCPLRHLHDKR